MCFGGGGVGWVMQGWGGSRCGWVECDGIDHLGLPFRRHAVIWWFDYLMFLLVGHQPVEPD